jgi:homocysteine S-methyltransferase
MSKYRDALPQLGDRLFITDGGLETTAIFRDNLPLRDFASFELLEHESGRRWLEDYFMAYVRIAKAHRAGLVLESPTWRANRDRGARLGYDAAALDGVNRRAIEQLAAIRERFETAQTPMVISGNIGPRGDGYQPTARMTSHEAAEYHAPQIATFASTAADMVAAFTINYVEEGIGVVRAARRYAMPVTISFTLETDGRLPSGDRLAEAIMRTDAETGAYAAYYMINCAHPTHFEHALNGDWVSRIRGVRANASTRSHAELDEATELDAGNPGELGRQYVDLQRRLPHLTVVGGCCGTDERHIGAICDRLAAKVPA